MNTYKKALLTFIIALSFNFVNSQVANNSLNNAENFLLKENNLKANISEDTFNKNNFNFLIVKNLTNNHVKKNTVIVSRKKSTLFELTKINGAGYSNTLYLMTIAIYRV